MSKEARAKVVSDFKKLIKEDRKAKGKPRTGRLKCPECGGYFSAVHSGRHVCGLTATMISEPTRSASQEVQVPRKKIEVESPEEVNTPPVPAQVRPKKVKSPLLPEVSAVYEARRAARTAELRAMFHEPTPTYHEKRVRCLMKEEGMTHRQAVREVDAAEVRGEARDERERQHRRSEEAAARAETKFLAKCLKMLNALARQCIGHQAQEQAEAEANAWDLTMAFSYSGSGPSVPDGSFQQAKLGIFSGTDHYHRVNMASPWIHDTVIR